MRARTVQFLKLLTPPLIHKGVLRIRYRFSHSPMNLKKLKQLEDQLPINLVKDMQNYLLSVDFDSTSRYWKYLMHAHLKMISQVGIENYGSSVATNYFTWKYADESMLHKLLENNQSNLSICKVQKGMNFHESVQHNIILELLHEYVISHPKLRAILETGTHSSFLDGNSPYLEFNDKPVTQDLLNTLIEFESFSSTLAKLENPRVLEIGAGSGRTMDLIMSLFPNARYVVVDIPPASYLARMRIQKAYPNARVSQCNSRNELETMLSGDNYNILFIPPSLVEYLPYNYFDTMLAIDCLHEMNFPTRKKYADLASRVSKYLYVKIWENAYIPVDRERVDASNLESYGFSPSWEVLSMGNAVFPATMYEYLFQTNWPNHDTNLGLEHTAKR